MDQYAIAAQTALRIIAQKGRDVTIARIEKTFDPVSGANVPNSQVSAVIKGVVLPIANTPKSMMLEADNNRFKEALVRGKLRYLILSAVGCPFEPVANDILEIGDDTFSIIGCSPLAPAGSNVIFQVVAEISQETVELVTLPITGWEDFGNLTWAELEAS